MLSYIKSFIRIYLGVCRHEWETIECHNALNGRILTNKCTKCGKQETKFYSK